MRQGGYFLPTFPIFFPSAWWYYVDRRGGRSSPLGGRKLSPAKKGENALVTETVSLELEPREVLGKKVKQLRRAGSVPVHLYGPSIESRALQCELSRLVRAVSQAGGNTPITLTVRGEEGERLAFAREIQWNPTRGDMLHVDFLVVEKDPPGVGPSACRVYRGVTGRATGLGYGSAAGPQCAGRGVAPGRCPTSWRWTWRSSPSRTK